MTSVVALPRDANPASPRYRAAMLLLLLTACVDPHETPAPPTLDEFLHQTWVAYAADDLATLGSLTALEAPTLDAAEFPMQGTYTDLTADEAALVALEWDADPAAATGFFLVDTLDCSADELMDALTNPEQGEVYPGNYTSYQRDFTTDFDAFIAGDTDILTWDTTYGVDIVVGAYDTFVHGGAFRLDVDGEVGFATRTWAPNPATTESPDLALDQDYQIEVYFPNDEGMVHVYGMWRQFQLDEATTQDNPDLGNVILSGMKGYFDDTSVYCQGLRG